MKQSIDWLNSWSQNRTGFHEGRVNPYLLQYLDRFQLNPGDCIFMPLCGKAVDILWLSQQGFRVIGVELSQLAINAFFEESSLIPEITRSEKFIIHRNGHITLYQGDFMDMRPGKLKNCKLVYDRASIVAIEPWNRATYVEQMLRIIPPRTPMLVITLDFDQSLLSPPPFSLSVDELRLYYQSRYQLTTLNSSEQIDERPKWRDAGLESLLESAVELEPL